MDRNSLEPPRPPAAETRIVYTCWPWSWSLCGLLTMLIGLALVLQHVYPGADELTWGIILLLGGGVVLLWGLRRGDTWPPGG